MRAALAAAVVTGILGTCGGLHAEEIPASSRIVSVKLFKNGLAVVTRVATVPGPGTYRIDDAPEPVHGTFWVESDAKVETRVVTREVEVPVRGGAGMDFQEALVGKQVVIHLRDGNIPPVNGTVEEVAPAAGEQAWNRAYEQPQYSYWGRSYGRWNQTQPQGQFLVVRTERGTTYVDSSMIAYLDAEGGGRTVRLRKPVLLVTAGKTKKSKPAQVTMTYLAKGMSWAPSYRVDISDDKTLAIEQKAVIKNELADIDGADVELISGFPSVKFSHVTSPLSARTTWAEFFRQVNQQFRPEHAIASNVGSQRTLSTQPGGLDMSAIPTGEGVDLHYQPAGKITLAQGDSLALGVASAKASYERIVEWIVPDTRNADGRHIQDYERQQDPEKYHDAAWDAVRFRNPLAFPMTTGPAMIVSNGRFNGQCMSYWVNPGEQTVLHVTKALSIRARAVEHELEGERKIVYVGGVTFRKTKVEGDLSVSNHRKEKISLVIRRQFSGDLLSADGEPECVLREEGVYSVNKRNELTWTLSLDPGEQRRLAYRYAVLVRH